MAASDLPVPAGAAELSADWFDALLRPALPQAAVQSASACRIGADYGLASEVYRCTLTGAGVPASVIVKLWDTTQPAGTREVHFYRELASRLTMRLPRCYCAATSLLTARGVLLLEDLTAAQQGDCLTSMALPDALALARELAALHAAWWASPVLDLDWLPRLGGLKHDAAWHAQRRRKFLWRFGEGLDPLLRSCVTNGVQLQARANELLAGLPSTLLHNDLHLDNVLFAPPARQVVLLDWARVSAGPAILDLVELACAMVDTADREPVVETYRTALATGGIVLTREQLEVQLAGALLRRCLTATLGSANWEPQTPRAQAILALNLQRQARAMAWLASTFPGLTV